ncbi:hypothetical protein QFC22_000057 [Naganishia vaughanmartiniae]|uniref:Uncharacterized protein n=1 Tax=Naganishia vaughanmartiniae TaxID=1424756 RepID=A0ACC2XNS7_9TREE|nr:hypothetical protein QFC22_000057 [Naganishia vaughanmartiniae]
MSNLSISILALPRFLEVALIHAGYSHLDDLENIDADELASDLKISSETAQDVLRQVEYRKAGPSSLRSRPSTIIPSHSAAQQAAAAPAVSQSQTASSLLRRDFGGSVPTQIPNDAGKGGTSVDLVRSAFVPAQGRGQAQTQVQVQGWTTGNTSIDHLLSPPPFTPLPANTSTTKAKTSGGGVRPGMVLGLAAPPGTGKTSLIIRVALSARLQTRFTDICAQVDAEGSITGPKLLRAATAVLRLQNHGINNNHSNQESSPTAPSGNKTTPKQLLDGIHVIRVTTQPEMLAFWYTIDDWLRAHPRVKLVAVDTLSYFFRNPAIDLGTKKRLLEMVKQKIAKASTVYGCAVIIASQMATKLLTNENKPAATFEAGDKAILMPQLGDLWVPPKALKLSLFKAGKGYGTRYAHVQAQIGEKGERPWAEFEIDGDGLITDPPATVEMEPDI